MARAGSVKSTLDYFGRFYAIWNDIIADLWILELNTLNLFIANLDTNGPTDDNKHKLMRITQ
jgi:hypothetical protein